MVNERLQVAIRYQADRRNADYDPHNIKCGTQLWLCLDRVKDGYACKLAHMWHGPFRVAELYGDNALLKMTECHTEYFRSCMSPSKNER